MTLTGYSSGGPGEVPGSVFPTSEDEASKFVLNNFTPSPEPGCVRAANAAPGASLASAATAVAAAALAVLRGSGQG